MAKTTKQIMAGNKSIFGLFLAAVIVLAVGGAASKTLFDQIQFRNRVITERREVQKVIDSNLGQIDELKTSYDLFTVDELGSDVLFQILAPNYDFTAFAAIVNEIALSSGINGLTEISPLDELETDTRLSTKESVPQPFQVQLAVNGDYSSIRTFISNMQNAAQPIEITELEISGEENLTASMTVTSYYQQKVGIEAGEETVQ